MKIQAHSPNKNYRLSFFLASIAFLLIISISGCGGGSTPTSVVETVPVPVEIVAAIRATADVITIEEKTTTVANARFFILTFKQPVDHKNPQGATFEQTATLLLRDRTAPMVLAATGYGVSRTNTNEQEPTRLLNANQLTMEHRYFLSSTPQPTDWKFLDIWQAANDEHRLIQAFKPLFSGKWITTGASKGGMTSIFHRRFFPNDVSATIAYVAPIMFEADDNRFIPFIQSRGTSENRAAIEAWQQAMLDHREEMKTLLKVAADEKKASFNYLGLDKTCEFAVIEAPFTLWQYGDTKLAEKVPKPNATSKELFQYLDESSFGVVDTWADTALIYYQAYYYQTATQLGYGAVPESHLRGLKYPGQDVGNAYPPYGIGIKVFDPQPMRDVRDWVAQSASQMMFIYGENDPWSAAAFTLSNEAKSRDNWRYDVPLGNHGAKLGQLPLTQRNEAYAKLGTWAGVKIPAVSSEPEPKIIGKFDHAKLSQ
jgi:hypothetical protein